jgi:hypothetical protein
MFMHNFFNFGAIKSPFPLREEVPIQNRLFSFFPGVAGKNGLPASGLELAPGAAD